MRTSSSTTACTGSTGRITGTRAPGTTGFLGTGGPTDRACVRLTDTYPGRGAGARKGRRPSVAYSLVTGRGRHSRRTPCPTPTWPRCSIRIAWRYAIRFAQWTLNPLKRRVRPPPRPSRSSCRDQAIRRWSSGDTGRSTPVPSGCARHAARRDPLPIPPSPSGKRSALRIAASPSAHTVPTVWDQGPIAWPAGRRHNLVVGGPRYPVVRCGADFAGRERASHRWTERWPNTRHHDQEGGS
jgi:hypothetical protein